MFKICALAGIVISAVFAQSSPPNGGGGGPSAVNCAVIAGSPNTAAYTLQGTGTGTNCVWAAAGSASVDNNALKNASYIADTSGTINAITGTTTTAFPGAYAAGQHVLVKMANTNSGATTINVNSLGVKNVTTQSLTALASGALTAGGIYWLTYDGTEFQLIASSSTGTVTHTAGSLGSSSIVVGNGGADVKTTGASIDGSGNVIFTGTVTESGSTPVAIAGVDINTIGQVTGGSHLASGSTVVAQKFFGTAAPGSVSGNLPGDFFSDTTNHNDYWCNAPSGTAAPACVSVASGGWTILNGGGGGGSSFGISLAGTTTVATVTYTGTPSGAGDLRVSQPAGTQTISAPTAGVGDTAYIWLSSTGVLNVGTQSAQTLTISGTSVYTSGVIVYPNCVTQIGRIAITSGNTWGTYTPDYTGGAACKPVTGTGGIVVTNAANLITVDGSGISGTALSPVNTTVTFSATPTYTVSANSNPQNFLITLTANITSSTLVTTSATAGQIISFTWCQDATGSRTNALPSNVLGAGTLSATASACSSQLFIWDGTNANAKGSMTYSAAAASGIQTSSGLLGFPTAPDTMAGIAATQTLTNKSIAASEVNSGTLSASQMPALTGDCTTSAGAVAVSCGTAIARTGTDINTSNQVTIGSHLTNGSAIVGQKFFGTAAPGSVAGNLPGDLFSDTTNHNIYQCNAVSGTGAPACTSVATGGWTLINVGGGSGSVTSIATTGPITGGTITTTGTIACATCITGSPTNHGVALGSGTQANGYTAAGTAKTMLVSGGASADPGYIDFPQQLIIPAANCVAATAGSGWSAASSTFTAACRAGTNNLSGALQAIPSTGAAAQFLIELPLDWDTASQPFISILYGSGANTSGTVIWTVSSACSKQDGSVTDDPAFNAETAFASQTMATANRTWGKSGQFTAITSGNNCVGGSQLIVKVAVSGTAASNINAYQATVTIPRLLTVQAN